MSDAAVRAASAGVGSPGATRPASRNIAPTTYQPGRPQVMHSAISRPGPAWISHYGSATVSTLTALAGVLTLGYAEHDPAAPSTQRIAARREPTDALVTWR